MDPNDPEPYDPPILRQTNRPGSRQSVRGSPRTTPGSLLPSRPSSVRTSTLAASSQTSLPLFGDDVHSDTDASLSDEPRAPLVRQKPLVDLRGPGDSENDGAALDEMEDRKAQRPGRASKGAEEPGTTHSAGMEEFLAQVYDLTHAVDALENKIDDIFELRNKIKQIDPRVDAGSVSITADLHALSFLTSETGKAIVAIETWLKGLYARGKELRALAKSGALRPEEMGEIKFQLSSVKLDFADAMEEIREGAWKEERRRERTRIWMAARIRAREPEIDDQDVKALVKAAELGARDGIQRNDNTSYAGLWALNNPFTELAELTDGSRFLHDPLDREIVDQVVPRVRNSKSSPARRTTSASSRSVAPPARAVYGSRLGVHSRARNDPGANRRVRYVGNDKEDLEYGYARERQIERTARRKRLVIALLAVVIVALVLLIWFTTMSVPNQQYFGDQRQGVSYDQQDQEQDQVPDDGVTVYEVQDVSNDQGGNDASDPSFTALNDVSSDPWPSSLVGDIKHQYAPPSISISPTAAPVQR